MINNIEEFIEEARISLLDFYCIGCGEENLNNFYSTTKNMCKVCLKLKQKEYYIKNKCQNPEDIENEFVLKQRITQAKVRAIKKNIIFDLDLEDIIFLLRKQNYRCYYSGIIFDNTNKYYSLSLDRTDSTRGYTLDNVRIVCSIVNIMKNDLKEKDFLDIIKKIEKNMV